MNQQEHNKQMELRFKLFFISSAFLLLGLCGITYVEFYMEPSIEQEFVGFTSLVVSAIGGLGCILGYLTILWHRLKGFFTGERQ